MPIPTRFTPDQQVHGILILEITSPSTLWTKVKYKIRFSCGHTGTRTGAALYQRMRWLEKGKATSLCSPCAHAEGLRRAEKTRKSRAAGKKPSLSPQEALALFK